MIREVADGGRWTLPGGWTDVNLTPAENVIKEVAEESGFQVQVRKLAALWDRTRQGYTSGMFSCCKVFYICDVVGGAAEIGPETSGIGWFGEGELPDDLSLGRVLPAQLQRMFVHARDSVVHGSGGSAEVPGDVGDPPLKFRMSILPFKLNQVRRHHIPRQ